MFRYQDGFVRLAELARRGVLGEIFGIRAHMSTSIPVATEPPSGNTRSMIATHPGGILFDLGGHMLDQVLWLMQDERPVRVRSFLRNDATPEVPAFADNTLGVFEFRRAMAMVDIAAMEARPMARRFEVYGKLGSAIMDPMEPATRIRLCLESARGPYSAGEQEITLASTSRQRSYELELKAFLPVVRGERPPERPFEHDLLVQETLLRATGRISGG
jgi:predicted dehydrogenase